MLLCAVSPSLSHLDPEACLTYSLAVLAVGIAALLLCVEFGFRWRDQFLEHGTVACPSMPGCLPRCIYDCCRWWRRRTGQAQPPSTPMKLLRIGLNEPEDAKLGSADGGARWLRDAPTPGNRWLGTTPAAPMV